MSGTDPSFDTDGTVKGSYVRAIEDIERALDYLRVDKMSDHAAFLFYYLSCEKLARIMKGICSNMKKKEIFKSGGTTPGAADIYKYSQQLNCHVKQSDIDWIFDREKSHSARKLRDNLIHEIGPSHAKQIMAHSQNLVPRMRAFLECRGIVVQYLQSKP